MFYLSKLLDYLVAGYSISTIAFLLVSFVIKELKLLRSNYLNFANKFALFLSVAIVVIAITNYMVNYKALQGDHIVYRYFRAQFYTEIVTAGLIPLVFLAERFRRSLIFTMLVILSVNWILVYGCVYIWLTQRYRDYLPSSWSVYDEGNPSLYIGIATIFYFSISLFIAKRGKTNA